MRYRKFVKVLFSVVVIFMFLFLGQVYALSPCTEDSHTFNVELIDAATGESSGLRRYTCTVCGHTYDEIIAPTGHQWGDWATAIKPSCISEGYAYSICSKCGEKRESLIAALGHNYIKTEQPADCTAEGIITYTCGNCGDSIVTLLPKLPHEYELSGSLEPKEGRAGWTEYTCKACGDSFLEEIPALEKAPVIITEAPPEEELPAETLAIESDEISAAAAETEIYNLREPPASSDTADSEKEFIKDTKETFEQLNFADILLGGGTAAAALIFFAAMVPYIKVIKWGEQKKRIIDARRRGE